MDRVQRADRRWTLIDYVRGITGGINPTADQRLEWNSFWERWNETLDRPDPATLEAFLQRLGVTLDALQLELLKDYRHFWETGTHRRPDVWRERGKWRHY